MTGEGKSWRELARLIDAQGAEVWRGDPVLLRWEVDKVAGEAPRPFPRIQPVRAVWVYGDHQTVVGLPPRPEGKTYLTTSPGTQIWFATKARRRPCWRCRTYRRRRPHWGCRP